MYIEILLSHYKEWNNLLSEISQRKTNFIWYCLYAESKKMYDTKMNLFMKQKPGSQT